VRFVSLTAPQVWHDRVALRRLLKARAVELQDALTRLGSRLDRLWLHSLSSDQRAAVTALRTQEVHAHLAQHCGLKPATQLVLVNVLRQLANFALTGYEGTASARLRGEGSCTQSPSSCADPPHSESEKEFNRALRASEDGFSAAREYLDGEPGSMASFLARIRELARTKSLSRRRSAPDGVPRVVSSQAVAPAAAAAAPAAAASTASQGTAVAGDSSGDEHGHEAGAPASRPVERKAQSFRADRRLLRLLIAQLMAERAVAAAAAAAAAAGAASA
jgi:hypothetical protein